MTSAIAHMSFVCYTNTKTVETAILIILYGASKNFLNKGKQRDLFSFPLLSYFQEYILVVVTMSQAIGQDSKCLITTDPPYTHTK